MNPLKAFFARLMCTHRLGTLVAIEWDGTSVYRCCACGKHVRKPL